MASQKKVLFVITKGNFGGAQRYVFDLATGLAEHHFDAVVACGEGSSLPKKLEEEGIRTVFVQGLKRDLSIFGDLRAFFSLLSIIRKERPSVLHLNSSKAGFLGACAARLFNLLQSSHKKVRIIFTGHGWAFNEDRPKWQKGVFFILHWLTIVFSHATIAVAKRTADQISQLPFTKKKLHVIYNGIAPFPLASQSESRHALAPHVHEKIWLGTLSELHPNKGLDRLMESFALLAERYANIALIIVGEGEEMQPLRALSEELGVEERVHFTGFVPEARTYLKAFDIFTLTSRTEAFPFVLLEAGIAKVPIVASWVGGVPELIVNKTSGMLVDSENIPSLAEALETLMNDQKKREEMANALEKRIEESFSLSKMLRLTSSLYKN